MHMHIAVCVAVWRSTLVLLMAGLFAVPERIFWWWKLVNFNRYAKTSAEVALEEEGLGKGGERDV